MRKGLMGAIAAIVLTVTAASAGDLYRPPPPGPCGPQPCGPPPGPCGPPPCAPPPYWSWAGPYVGANLGFQSSVLSNSGARPSGVAGGFQGGYNWQFGQFVAGWETDFQLSSANDVFANYKFSNPWFGTTRGRGGFAFNNILFYGTLGLAYGRGHVDIGSLGEDSFRVGWTAGVGVEMGLLPNWSVKAEYLFIDLASETYGLTLSNNALTSNLIRFGFNYRF
jgi:outer membrane immunogenic protein